MALACLRIAHHSSCGVDLSPHLSRGPVDLCMVLLPLVIGGHGPGGQTVVVAFPAAGSHRSCIWLRAACVGRRGHLE